MFQFAGEYECKIDAKGRIKLPSNLIKQITDSGGGLSFSVNRGFEKHLMLYPKNVWEKKTKEINQLNIYVKKNREAVRYFYRGATQLDADSSDRILLPKSLIEYAGIAKEIILFAYHEQIEIWAKDKYVASLNEEPAEFSELAEAVFGPKDKKADGE